MGQIAMDNVTLECRYGASTAAFPRARTTAHTPNAQHDTQHDQHDPSLHPTRVNEWATKSAAYCFQITHPERPTTFLASATLTERVTLHHNCYISARTLPNVLVDRVSSCVSCRGLPSLSSSNGSSPCTGYPYIRYIVILLFFYSFIIEFNFALLGTAHAKARGPAGPAQARHRASGLQGRRQHRDGHGGRARGG